MAAQLVIRKFNGTVSDRTAIREICCETGIAGRPIEPAWRGREVFADFWTAYYTDYEPKSCFVADYEGRAVGYLTGCLNTADFNRVMRQRIGPELMRKAVTSGFLFRPVNLRRLFGLWRCSRRGELNEPDLTSYPAHLHINFRDGFRGTGAGAQLIRSFFEYCTAANVAAVHLGSFSHRAIPFFARNGFSELSRRRFTLYDDIVTPLSYLVFMGARL